MENIFIPPLFRFALFGYGTLMDAIDMTNIYENQLLIDGDASTMNVTASLLSESSPLAYALHRCMHRVGSRLTKRQLSQSTSSTVHP